MYTLQIHTCTIKENYKEISWKLQYYKTETTHRENKLVVTSGESEDTGSRLRGTTTVYKINKHQGYIVQHKETQPLFCYNFKQSTIYKNTQSLWCMHTNLQRN